MLNLAEYLFYVIFKPRLFVRVISVVPLPAYSRSSLSTSSSTTAQNKTTDVTENARDQPHVISPRSAVTPQPFDRPNTPVPT